MNETTPKPPYGYMPPKFGGEGMGNLTDDCLIYYRSTKEWLSVLATNLTKTIFYPNRHYTRPIDPGEGYELVGEGEKLPFDYEYYSERHGWLHSNNHITNTIVKEWLEGTGGILAIRRPKKPVPQPQSEWPKYWAINGKFVYRKLALSTRQEQWTGIEWVPTSETISTPMKPITPEQAAEITGEAKLTKPDAKVTDTQWHFLSKGEFPEPFRQIEFAWKNGTRGFGSYSAHDVEFWKQNQSHQRIYCWRYCDPLPPIPEVKAEDDGFEKWWINKGYQETRADKGDARITWLAAQSALLNKGKGKEKE